MRWSAWCNPATPMQGKACLDQKPKHVDSWNVETISMNKNQHCNFNFYHSRYPSVTLVLAVLAALALEGTQVVQLSKLTRNIKSKRWRGSTVKHTRKMPLWAIDWIEKGWKRQRKTKKQNGIAALPWNKLLLWRNTSWTFCEIGCAAAGVESWLLRVESPLCESCFLCWFPFGNVALSIPIFPVPMAEPKQSSKNNIQKFTEFWINKKNNVKFQLKHFEQWINHETMTNIKKPWSTNINYVVWSIRRRHRGGRFWQAWNVCNVWVLGYAVTLSLWFCLGTSCVILT